jgi:hypothetical protein
VIRGSASSPGGMDCPHQQRLGPPRFSNDSFAPGAPRPQNDRRRRMNEKEVPEMADLSSLLGAAGIGGAIG